MGVFAARSVIKRSITLLVAIGSLWSCLPVFADTVADSFSIQSYANNSGTANWNADWQEYGESGTLPVLASYGVVRLGGTGCTSSFCLFLGSSTTFSGSGTHSNIGISRSADLSSAGSATLTFNYQTTSTSGSTTVTLSASSDGSSWTTLQTYNISSTNTSSTAQSFDLTSYISSTTYIRFSSASSGSTDTGMSIDDVVITYSAGGGGSSDDQICTDTSSTNTSGSLTDSGGSGGNYSINESCQFLIQPSGGGNITFSFSAFNYESSYDYIYIYDGMTISSSTIIGSYTGTSVPADVIATSGSMLILHSSDYTETRSGFQGSWSTATGSSCPSQTVADNFPSVSYSQNAGSVNWTTDWLEIGETDGVSAGISRVRNDNCTAGQCLRIGEPSSSNTWTNLGAQREANLSTATSATLSFNYYTGQSFGSETVTLDISSDGGSNWTTLQTYNITGTNFSPTAQSFNIGAYTAANTRIRFLSSGTSAVIGMYIDDIQISYDESCPAPSPVAEWRMDEGSWNGTANEVVDNTGNGHEGTAQNGATTASITPATTGNPGACGYGEFDGNNDYVSVPWSSALNTDDFTISFWAKVTGGDGAYRSAINSRGQDGTERFGFTVYAASLNRWEFWTGNDTSGPTWHSLIGPAVTNNTWAHITVSFEQTGTGTGTVLLGTKSLYVDGVEVSSETNAPYRPMRYTVTNPYTIGAGGTNGDSFRFYGHIDEFRFYNQALSVSQILAIKNETHPCSVYGPDHFLISHDNNGIHCSGETVTVTARHTDNSTKSDYAGTITLDTQIGKGTWSLVTGAGTLTDATSNDGLATYTFTSADSGVASFSLYYPEGTNTFNIDVYDGSVRDNDAEGDISFAPSGFILSPTEVTTAGTYNSTIPTQTAGSDFAVHITAYGTTATDTTCGIIETYTGNKSIGFFGSYNNPSSGTLPITINSTNIAMSGSASTQTISFSSGKAQVTANYKDAGSIRFSATDSSGANTISSSTNNFVVKPANFVFSSVQRSSDSVANPGATTASGTVFAKAGESFTVTISAINSLSQVTPNYGNESSAEGITLAHALVEPSGGAAGTLTGSLSKLSGGVFSGTFNWSEVGIISLTAAVSDSDYLGVGNITKSLSHVGRFTPDHFEVANSLNGALEGGCSAGGFSYIGEAFGYTSGNNPEFDIQAKSLSGATTLNYTGSFAKLVIGNVSVSQVTQDATQAGSDTTTPMAITHTQATATLGTFNNGVSKFTFGADQFTYTKDSNSIVGKFDSDIDITVSSITDSDSVTDNFASHVMQPTLVNLRYGRLMIDDAYGSELLDLAMPIKLQMYDSSIGDYVTNTADTCSSLPSPAMTMVDSLDPSGLTTSFSSLVAGEAALTIGAPGSGNTGSIEVMLDVVEWLQFDWGKPLAEANRLEPKATATFGIFQGNTNLIYRREIR